MRFALILAATAALTFGLVWAIATVAVRYTGVPEDFPPFTTLPLLSGVLGGFIGASAAYGLIRLFASNPDRIFFFVALSVLALSFGLPLRLSYTRSHRFAGVTPSAQMTLALLHCMIATAAVTALTKSGIRG